MEDKPREAFYTLSASTFVTTPITAITISAGTYYSGTTNLYHYSPYNTTDNKNCLIKGIEIPKYAGAYDITGQGGIKYPHSINFSFHKKPFFIHRFFARILLGWKWVDSE